MVQNLHPKTPPSPHHHAEKHLARCHPSFRQLIRRVGPCTMQANADHFRVLVRTIVSQQLSTMSANAILARLVQAGGRRGLRPQQIQRLSDADLRRCGLSGGKVRSLRDLSAKVLDGALPLKKVARLPDDEVRDRLLAVHGIGPWSVDMFLMFSLGRPDVLPVGDLGFRAGVRDLLALSALPKPVELEELAEPWRPYRSIAAWYCWRVRDNGAK